MMYAYTLPFGFRIPFERPFDIFLHILNYAAILRIKNVCFLSVLCVLVSLEVRTVRFLVHSGRNFLCVYIFLIFSEIRLYYAYLVIGFKTMIHI